MMRARVTRKAERTNQGGMVSFLVVLIMMMVITLIVMGFVQVTNQNRREALDRQLSNQAFYAAESGINSVLSVIKQKQHDGESIPTQQNCGGGAYPQVDFSGGVKTTCLLVDPRSDSIEISEVNASVPKVIPIQAVGADGKPAFIRTLTFEWTSEQDTTLICTGVGLYPPSADDCPPLLRVDLTRGTGGTAEALNSQTNSVFLQRAAVAPAMPLTIGLDGQTLSSGAECTVSDGKSVCKRTISFAPSDVSTVYARVLTIYRTALSLKVTGTLIDDTTAYFIGQVKIDATGKAQDVLRRIQVRVNPDSTSKLTMPTSAIFSDGSVCKRFITGVDGTYANMANECEDVPSEDIPDAGLGGCGSACLPTGGGGPAVGDRIFYNRRYSNTSNNASSSVTGCTWSWGDKTSDVNKWCLFGDITESHAFPKTYPGTTVKCYIVTIKLTITTSGGVKSALMDQKIPYGPDANAFCGGVYKRMP
jgi:hypothetical protein